MILLQIDPVSGDEHEIICEGCYETEDIFIFAWFLVSGIRHYCWLRGPIRRFLLIIKRTT